MKMNFQVGVDKEDINDDNIILILNPGRTKKGFE
jgi:hypothetical protein